MSKKSDFPSFSDKITSLIQTKPTFIDSDDDLTTIEQIRTTELSDKSDNEDLQIGKFRKLNIEFLDAEDKKYSGRKSSRRELTDDNAFGDDTSDVESTDEEGKEEEGEEGKENLEGETEEEEEEDWEEEDTEEEQKKSLKIDKRKEEDDDDDEGEEEEVDSETENDVTPNQDSKTPQISHFSSKLSDDVEKGKAIQHQLGIWDKLLECRIQFQKTLLASNQLPNPTKFEKFKLQGGTELTGLLTENKKCLTKLLGSLLELQDTTLSRNKEFSGNKKDSDEEITSESDGEKITPIISPCKKRKIDDYSSELEDRHAKFKSYRDATIRKWSDKTTIGQRNSKNFNAFEQSTLKQIESILSDKQRLIQRTRVKRTNYHIVGERDDEEGSPPTKQIKVDTALPNTEQNREIFDDGDFYHQLLRELLERKASDVTDPVQLSRQWIQLQKARSKMKKNVDTRASKGRKVRFLVHSKLVNFMMPIDNNVTSEMSRQELFNSLFGKRTSS